MLDLRGYKGFCLVSIDSCLEALRLRQYCWTKDIELISVSRAQIPCPPEYVPLGSIDWCTLSLGKEVVPDYYPEWLSEKLYRKVWREDKWITGRRLFVKPAGKHKRFTGFITSGTYSKKKRGPLIWSEIVSFKNEWRYYISNGEVLCAYWYDGDNQSEAPSLDIAIPEAFCGAVDFGTLPDGRLGLVESNSPFSCGWYGPQEADEKYFQWIVDGWRYMQM